MNIRLKFSPASGISTYDGRMKPPNIPIDKQKPTPIPAKTAPNLGKKYRI